jgi:hypothetical protein
LEVASNIDRPVSTEYDLGTEVMTGLTICAAVLVVEKYYPPSESADGWGRCSNDDDVRKKVIPIEDGRERPAEALAT